MSKRVQGIGYPRLRVESQTYRTRSRPFANLCWMQLLWVHMGAYQRIVPIGSAVQLPRYFRKSPHVFDLALLCQATSRTCLSLVFCTSWLMTSLVGALSEPPVQWPEVFWSDIRLSTRFANFHNSLKFKSTKSFAFQIWEVTTLIDLADSQSNSQSHWLASMNFCLANVRAIPLDVHNSLQYHTSPGQAY